MTHQENVEILLVEDNSRDAELTLRALRKRNLANQVVWVQDGQAALEFVFGPPDGSAHDLRRPRLILLDLKLPKLDGIEVLQRLKSDPRTATIPVVMLTSSREEQDVLRSYRHGANSYIVKPVDFDNFSEAVARLGMYWLLLNEAVEPKRISAGDAPESE